jgi:penicillin-binding protein 2
LDNGYSPNIEALAEVNGNFNKIDSVSYADSGIPALAAADEDGDTGTEAPEREATDVVPQVRATAPNIRKQPDSNRKTPTSTPRRAGIFSRGASSSESSQPSGTSNGGFFRRLFRAPQ